MSPEKELITEADAEYAAEVDEWWQQTLAHFRKYDFEPSPTEVVYCKAVIRTCLEENHKIDKILLETGRKESLNCITDMHTEIITRLCWKYGINLESSLSEHAHIMGKGNVSQVLRIIYRRIQELRTERAQI
jgi:hypothetical protein